MNGSELAHHIKEQHPDIAVIGISAFLDDENEKDTEHNGPMRFMRLFQKKFPRFNWFESSEKPLEMTRLRRGREEHKLHAAFRQGITIIANYARGFTTSTIAHQLNISEASVKTYARRAFEKLHAHSRAEAVAMCVRNGWI